MSSKVVIIGLENQANDGKTAQVLAQEIRNCYGFDLNVIAPPSNQLKKLLGKQAKKSGSQKSLAPIVETYLKDENTFVIFVLDFDNPASKAKRMQEPNSWVSLADNITNNPKFQDSVFVCPAEWELEAWLLVDCVGICCYYLVTKPGKTYNKDNCRDKVNNDKKLLKVVKDYQVGRTENIMEPESGKKGVKEHLIRFSRAILEADNPNNNQQNRRPDVPKKKLYKEREASAIAGYLQIDTQTLKRNSSLQHFADTLRKCAG